MLKRGSTKIRQVRFIQGGGIEIDYVIEQASGDGSDVYEIKKKYCTPEEFDDFFEVSNSFIPHVVRDNYILGVGFLGKEIEDLEEGDRVLLDEIYRKINIDKIAISGKNCDRVKISARIKGIMGNVKTMQAGPFNIKSSSDYPFAEDLNVTTESLIEAVIVFLNREEYDIRSDD